MIRIAWRTARRIIGPPARPISRLNALWTSRLVSSARSTRWPVSISPQVEALTSTESDWPTWRFQSASPSLSRISLSAVSGSGMRSSASATHISSTPSSLPRSYWRMKASITPWCRARTRTRLTRSAAAACAALRSASGRRACSSRARTCSASSRAQPAVIAARGPRGGVGSSGLISARRGTAPSATPVARNSVVIGPAAQPGKVAQFRGSDGDGALPNPALVPGVYVARRIRDALRAGFPLIRPSAADVARVAAQWPGGYHLVVIRSAHGQTRPGVPGHLARSEGATPHLIAGQVPRTCGRCRDRQPA